MKKMHLFFFLATLIPLSVLSQQPSRTVSGTVIGPEGPLAGVSVSTKRAGRQVATDPSGHYSITVMESDTLVFSNVGYETLQLPTANLHTVDATLILSTASLDEVVVVGYGTQTRRNVTGSVIKVDMKQTENLPNTNVTQSLRGRVAGVQFIDNGRPGQNGSILIRGPRSLSGGNNPLIVLDGIFFNGSLAEINPNDIESMEILKDASAAAIYGSRAANGVILITSKRGTTEKPTIRLNAFAGIADRAYKVKLLTPERYIQRKIDYNKAVGLPYENISDLLHPSELANYESGHVVDHWNVVSQNSNIGSYDLSVSGNTKRTNYLLSSALVNEKGLYLNDNMKRVSVRSNLETAITDWLKVGVNSIYSWRDYSGLEPAQASNIGPYSTPFYPDGEPTLNLLPEDQTNQSNPVRRSILTTNEEIWNNIFANLYAVVDIPFIDGLSYRLNYSPNIRWRHNYNFMRQDKHIAANTTSADKFNQNDFDWVLENILTYTKQINQDHQFDITLMYGTNHTKWESTTATASELSTDVLGWNNLNLGAVLTNSSAAEKTDGVSSMARLNYQFKRRYLITLTARRDGSSVFAANNKYATFPSAALGWIVSDEPFMANAKGIDLLKLRVSYGAVGNQAISPYQSLGRSSMNRYVFGDGGSSLVGIYPSGMGNDNLKWETTYTFNTALDVELLRQRLGGSVEVYQTRTNDLLVWRALPQMTGVSGVWTNIGATGNRGVEVSINSVNLKSAQFEWSTQAVYSHNRNKIISLYGPNSEGKEEDDLGNRWFIGKPINVAYDYVFDGIYQEGDEIPTNSKPGWVRLKDLDGNGIIEPTGDRTIVGQTGQPKYRWGLTNTFRYKGFTLSAFVNAMHGWIASIDLDPGIHTHRNYNRIDAGWWTPENKSTSSPSVTYLNPLGHAYYRSRSFVRIQDVSFAYDFSGARFLDKLNLNTLRVYVSGKNLYTFTDWPGADPESGANQNGIPASRTFTLGINVAL